jgi:hypothetical protein
MARMFTPLTEIARGARRRSADQRGIAMITAMAVVTIVFLLSVVAAQVAFHGQSTTSLDRSRTQAVGAAEAGLDLALLKAGDDATPPCDDDVDGQIKTQPKNTNYDVSIVYYGTYPVSSGPLDCAQVEAGTVIPKAALISSVGSVQGSTAGLGKRTVESLVKLTAIPSNAFNKAIFADASLAVSNSVHVRGNVGSDANVYVNGPLNCNNSVHVEGGVVTQGTATLSNSCTIDVDLWAKGSISMINSAKVLRDAKSSTGSITMDNSTEVGHDATAAGSITTTGSATIRNSRFPYTPLPPPTVVTLPEITFDSAAWTTAAPVGPGYELVNWTGPCGLAHKTTPTGVYLKIKEMETAIKPRVILTSCKIAFANNTDVFLAKDLAIFSTAGFETANSTKIVRTGTDPSPRRLYWIVPTGSSCTVPAGNGNISLSNSTQFTTIETFFYTPCTYIGNNSAHFVGQVYAKNVNITNSYELSYVPLPVFGASGGGGVERYQVDTVYKRENVTGS